MEKFDDIKNDLKGLSHIQLSKNEKESIRDALTEYISYKPNRSKETYENTSYRFWLTWMRQPMPVFAAVLIFLVGGGTVAAAEGALPGDVLYPIKVSVNEEIRGTFALSSEAKADWNITRAERRLEEASLLLADGELSEETRKELDMRIENYTDQAQLLTQNTRKEDERFIVLATRLEIARGARDRITRAVSRASATIAGSGVATHEMRNVSAFDADEEQAPESALFIETMRMESTSLVPDDSVHTTALSKSEENAYKTDRTVNGEQARARTQLTALQNRLKSTHTFIERARHRITESSYSKAEEELQRMEELLRSGIDALAQEQFSSASVSFENALQLSLDIHDIVNIGENPIQPVREVEFHTPTIDPIPSPTHLPLEITPVETPKRPIL